MNMPTISIIVPFYNRESTIVSALKSAAAQCYDIDEIIAVDDGSTDKSLLLAQALCDEITCLSVITQRNKGVSSARNYGVSRAKSDVIVFLDSDDLMLPSAIQHVREAFNEPIDFCWASVRYKYADGSTRDKLFYKKDKDISSENYVLGMASSFCLSIRRSTYNEAKGFDEQIRSSEDLELAIRLRNHSYSVIESVCFQINTGANNQLTKDDESRASSLKYVYYKHKSIISTKPKYLYLIFKGIYKCALRVNDASSLDFVWHNYLKRHPVKIKMIISYISYRFMGIKLIP